MAEFSTEASLLVRPDSASLKETRQEIEDSLGDVSVDVSTTGASAGAGRSGGGRIAGRERAMNRQLLDDQTSRLGTVTEHLETGLELDETRNDLLRDLIETTEKGNFTRARSGGGKALGMLAGGVGLSTLGPAIATRLADSMNVDVSPSDLVDSEATITEDALVATAAAVAPSAVIAAKAAPAVGDVIDGPVAPTVDDLIGDVATIAASDLLGSVPSAKEILTALIGGGTAAAGASQAAGSSSATGAAAGAGFPILTPEMFPGGSPLNTRDTPDSILTPSGRRERLGPVGGWLNQQLGTPANRPSDSGSGSNETARDRRDRRQGGGDVQVNATVNAGRSDRDVERIVQRKVDELRRELTGGR